VTRAHYLGPWRIDVTIRDDIAPIPIPVVALARSVAAALRQAGAPSPASIGLILSDDRELAELNVAHLGISGPTDVLSFPLLPPETYPAHAGSVGRGGGGGGGPVPAEPFPLPPGRRLHLGDIVMSVERAVAQADAGRGGQTGDVRWSAADELRLLATHGTLHICGWDHAVPAEEAAMRALEGGLLGLEPPPRQQAPASVRLSARGGRSSGDPVRGRTGR
jgi:probable rRNA maturation factor